MGQVATAAPVAAQAYREHGDWTELEASGSHGNLTGKVGWGAGQLSWGSGKDLGDQVRKNGPKAQKGQGAKDRLGPVQLSVEERCHRYTGAQRGAQKVGPKW